MPGPRFESERDYAETQIKHLTLVLFEYSPLWLYSKLRFLGVVRPILPASQAGDASSNLAGSILLSCVDIGV